MDKETLSNYGWIVICVLVLAVMIALAGPFGNFIADAVKSTTQGLFDVNQGALDAAGIVIDSNGFADGEGGGADGTPTLNEHGFYFEQSYSAKVSTFNDGLVILTFHSNGTVSVISQWDGYTETTETATFTVNDNVITAVTSLGEIPMIVSTNGTELECSALSATFIFDTSVVVDGDFLYIYDNYLGGYIVDVIDKSKTSYGAIQASINGVETVKLADAMFTGYSNSYIGNHNLLMVPEIPDSITIIGDGAFWDCTSLTSVTIPSSVTSIASGAFRDCSSLINITFEGTVEQWNNISKGGLWNGYIPATYVQCSDGTVSLS